MSNGRAPAPEWAAISTAYFRDVDTGLLPAALQLAHLRLILWTVEAQTDGHVDERHLTLAGVTRAHYRALEDVGLITAGRLRGWEKWQKPRAEWQDEHERRVHAGRLGACQKWHEIDCRCLAGEPPKRKPNVRST